MCQAFFDRWPLSSTHSPAFLTVHTHSRLRVKHYTSYPHAARTSAAFGVSENYIEYCLPYVFCRRRFEDPVRRLDLNGVRVRQ